MERALEDKVVVVTGGAKGLGRGSSMAAAQRGAKVIISGRDTKAGKEIVEEIKTTTNVNATFVEGDLTQVSACKALIDTAVSQFGRIDGLINYAGILPSSTITGTEESMFDDVFGINIKAPFFCTKFALASMLNSGGGSIVNIGSLHGYGGQRDRAAYACSKGALLALTKHISKNYAKERIRANWITMGWVATPGELALRHEQGLDMEWLEGQGREVMPMGRLQTVEDNIATIMLLLSDESSQLTGSELHISGGFFL